jgi:hypothetical protein
MNELLRSSCSALRISAGLFAIGMIAFAQFKEIGPAPFPPAQAHQKIRALLDQVDAANREQTVRTIVGWLDWYRDVADDELIAVWRGDKRVNLNLVIDELGDARVATEIARSWRQPGLNPAAAPILAKLMTRYSDSASPFFHDVLQTPDLSGPEAETVCRILLDLPDRWRGTALQVLPHYRRAAQNLLAQDLSDRDEEKVGRAQFWLRDLKWDVPRDVSGGASNQQAPRRTQPTAIASADPLSSRPIPSRPDQSDSRAIPPPLRSAQPVVPQMTYSGAQSGTLTCGGLIPQNAEFVFRNLPRGELKLEYDTKNWNARLVPGNGATQRLILTNVSSGPQKKCVVHWSAIR